MLTIVVGIVGLAIGLAALVYYKRQAWAATKDHLNNVHQLIFQRLDAPEIRAARHYVYSMDARVDSTGNRVPREPGDISNLTFESEHWLELDSPGCPGTQEDHQRWQPNKGKAEMIARALDQLGYLVREGIVPLNVVARFYSYPTLKCWYELSPYIAAVRVARKQHGHMWEWEHLVKKVIKGVRTDTGLWKGAGEHDNLKEYAERIEKRTKGFPTDEKWNPPDHFWECQ